MMPLSSPFEPNRPLEDMLSFKGMRLLLLSEYDGPGYAMMDVHDWLSGWTEKDQAIDTAVEDGMPKAESGRGSRLQKGEKVMARAW